MIRLRVGTLENGQKHCGGKRSPPAKLREEYPAVASSEIASEVEFLRPLAGFCGVCWVGSRLCFSARRGPAATAAVLQLAESAWVFRLGLTALRFLGRVLPELAGLGRMKANWNVLPIARVRGVSDPTTGIRV